MRLLRLHGPCGNANNIFSLDDPRTAPQDRVDGEAPVCCNTIDRCRHRDCLPIEIPPDDPIFAMHGRHCMEFERSLPGNEQPNENSLIGNGFSECSIGDPVFGPIFCHFTQSCTTDFLRVKRFVFSIYASSLSQPLRPSVVWEALASSSTT